MPRRKAISGVVTGLMLLVLASAAHAYDAAACNQVLGTPNIHWQTLVTPSPPCDATEFTAGTVTYGPDGSVSMSGTSTSDACLATAIYTFSVSLNGSTLIAYDSYNDVHFTLTRGPGQACFSGIWEDPDEQWLAYIDASVFPIRSVAPAMDQVGLVILLALLGAVAVRQLRRRPNEA